MSLIKRLLLTDFRLFPNLELDFVPGINLIHGGNGTGKTTVLEAVYLAGRGKSFRHHQSRPLIRDGKSSLMAVVHTEDPEGVIGVELSKTEIRIRMDSKELKKRSDLLHRIPLQLLTPQSHHLVESGPKARRVFLDFGLFHVEPSFHRLLSDFEKLLRQRNAQLANRQTRFQAFDPQLIARGESLAHERRLYGERLEKRLRCFLSELLPSHQVEFRYRSGWSQSKTFAEALREVSARDLKLGYTTVGPHRGGMEIWTELGPAAKVLSRGQQKILVFGLILAQAAIMSDETGRNPTLLIDDLSAELDKANQQRLIEFVKTLPMQVVVTNTEFGENWNPLVDQVFHVEHKKFDF